MKPIKRILLLLAAALFAFNSCQNNSPEQNNPQPPAIRAVTKAEPLPETTHSTAATVAEVEPVKDTLVIDPLRYPTWEDEIKLLQMGGRFHFDEVWKTASSENWTGIFVNKGAGYLAATKIKTRRVYDDVVDDEGEKTGWMVSSPNKDSCVILIQALPYLEDHAIERVKLAATQLVPGDTVAFEYRQVSYKLFAGGIKRPEERVPGSYVFINYRLYLSAIKNGQYITEILAAEPVLNDFYVPKIIFAGDIDGDDVPDLVIELYQFNSVSKFLFLSKPAGNGHLLISMGSHSTSGC